MDAPSDSLCQRRYARDFAVMCIDRRDRFVVCVIYAADVCDFLYVAKFWRNDLLAAATVRVEVVPSARFRVG